MTMIFVKYIITIISVIGGLLLTDIARGFGWSVAFLLLTVGGLIDIIFKLCGIDKWDGFFCKLGAAYYFLGLFSFCFVPHFVTNKDKSYVIYSPLYLRVLEKGYRVEKVELTCYNKYFETYNVDKRSFRFLYKSGSISIYDDFDKLLEIPDTTYTIEELDFLGHGPIQYIRCRGKVWDITKGEEIINIVTHIPYVRDKTPEFN